MTNRLLLIGILSASALFGACKKKDATTGAGSGSDTGSGSAMMGSSMAGSSMAGSGSAMMGSSMAGSGSAMAGSGSAMADGSGSGSAAAPAAGAIADNAAYTAKADAMTAKMTAVTKETDCGKLGAALSAEFDADKADIEALEAYEKAHPDDKKAYHHAHKDDRKKAMEPVMKCKDDPAVKAAMSKMH